MTHLLETQTFFSSIEECYLGIRFFLNIEQYYKNNDLRG